MTVTEESEGRLNVFAKEPEIQIIQPNSNASKGSRLIILTGAIILISIIGWYLIIK